MDEAAAARGRRLGVGGGDREVIGGRRGRTDSEVVEVGVEVVHDDGVEVAELVEVVPAMLGNG